MSLFVFNQLVRESHVLVFFSLNYIFVPEFSPSSNFICLIFSPFFLLSFFFFSFLFSHSVPCEKYIRLFNFISCFLEEQYLTNERKMTTSILCDFSGTRAEAAAGSYAERTGESENELFFIFSSLSLFLFFLDRFLESCHCCRIDGVCVCFFISLVEIYELPFRVHTFFIYIFSLYSFVYLHLLIFYAIKYQIILYIYISPFSS